MNTQEFSQKIKSKYPQYADMEDVELVSKVIAKYPQYESQLDDRSWLRRQAAGAGKGAIGTLTGISSLGERALRGTLKTVLPKKLEKRFGVEGKMEKTAAEKLIPEKFRVASEGEKAGFTIEQVAEFFIPIPGLRTAKVATKLSKASKTIKFIKGATETTAEFTARTAAQRGEVRKEDIAMGFGAVVAGGIVTKAGEQIFKHVPGWLMTKAVGKGNEAFKAGQSIPEYALKNKIVGTANHIFKSGEKRIESIIMEMRTKISKLDKKFGHRIANITPQAIQQETDKAIARFAKGKDPLMMTKQPLDDLAYYFGTQLDGFLKQSRMKLIPKQLDELRPLYSKLFNEIALNKSVKNIMQKTSNPLSYMNLLSGGIGSGLGFFTGIPGIIEGLAVKKIVTSTTVLSRLGVGIDQLRRVGPILNKLTGKEQQLLKGIFSQIIQGTSK